MGGRQTHICAFGLCLTFQCCYRYKSGRYGRKALFGRFGPREMVPALFSREMGFGKLKRNERG